MEGNLEWILHFGWNVDTCAAYNAYILKANLSEHLNKVSDDQSTPITVLGTILQYHSIRLDNMCNVHRLAIGHDEEVVDTLYSVCR
jgi:hypothetical protein